MRQAPAGLSLLMASSAMLSTFLAGWAITLRRSTSIMAFVLLMLAIAVYSAGYAIELSQTTLAGLLAAVRFEYLGLSFVPVLFFVATVRLFLDQRISTPVLAGLLVIPLITLVMVWTTPLHSLYYVDPHADSSGPFTVIAFERGPWYEVNFGYQTIMVLAATTLLLRYSLKVRRELGWASLFVGLAAVFPVLASLIYFLGWTPIGVDPVPLFLGFTGLAIAVALFGMRLFEMVPKAREVALDSIAEGLVVLDTNGTVRDYNRATTGLPGFERLDFGRPMPPDSPMTFPLKRMMVSGDTSAEFAVQLQEQPPKYYRAVSYPVKDPKGIVSGTALVVQDISASRLVMDRLLTEAATDELTQALSRRALTEQAGQAILQAQLEEEPIAILMVDLDKFKELNDVAGHAAGDAALVAAAAILRSALRSGDLLGRLGGDEFVIVLPRADLGTAELVANRLQRRFANLAPDTVAGLLSASIGVVAGTPDKANFADYLAAADRALYQAKFQGGNQIAVGQWP